MRLTSSIKKLCTICWLPITLHLAPKTLHLKPKKMKTKINRKSKIGLLIIWLAILVVGGYHAINIATMPGPDMVELRAEALGEGEPITATFWLNNPTDEEIAIK